jgi:hypothetical protein
MSQLDGSIVIISLPAIFRGIHLDPLGSGNISYLLGGAMLTANSAAILTDSATAAASTGGATSPSPWASGRS